MPRLRHPLLISICSCDYFLFRARSTLTAQATEQPTIGLLPMPRKPIISTWAGTEEEPANWASECFGDTIRGGTGGDVVGVERTGGAST